MLLDVFDLNSYVVTGSKGLYEPAHDYKKFVIIPGETHWILVDNEACHEIFSYTEKVDFEIYEKEKGGVRKIFRFPSKTLYMSFDEIKKEVPTIDEVELTAFIRSFGRRIESNYHLLLDSIKKIGLDPGEFPRKKEAKNA